MSVSAFVRRDDPEVAVRSVLVAGSAAVREVPGVFDAGLVRAVTLGRNGFDIQDNTEYRQKTPGVSAV
ncbi:hypothetical protein [Streptomyces yaizuensis]|uniref:Uncharacterized protein n=1 Tax=Streptomyces yaizuensis TaxID=2989713 RepID=A0ABQ5NYG6_9ACTN|nr:hypothetical protein [Streptomyces sp. YSPA8]GLF95225.1 hypothetical protein SYYSPA8_13030 [Streptomyces sp. YSPA8]